MDNWGDPWADNADNAKSRTKNEVASPLPPAFAAAPALLNGFLDDAGWGNNDDDFGDWSTARTRGVEDADPAEAVVTEAYAPHKPEQSPEYAHWDAGQRLDHDESDWAGVHRSATRDEEHVVSETSESSRTIQGNHVADRVFMDASVRLQPDDDSSARTSTSPSETSHNDAPAESPRTSYEEERGAGKVLPAEGEQDEADAGKDSGQTVASPGTPEEVSWGDNPIRNLSENPIRADEDDGDAKSEKSAGRTSAEATESFSVAANVSGPSVIARSIGASVFDRALLEQLFPVTKESNELDEAPDDPIHSTSGRKAWYRLTRKQTMREFNSGNDDDSYIRANWANSNVKSEVNKIVGRWAREDRISGTGPGARASFYWDTPAPTENELNIMHARQKPSISSFTSNAPRNGRPPPLSTNAPAAFNWSSTSAAANPWDQTSPGLRSTSSPTAPRHPYVTEVQRQEGRAVSVDLTLHKSNQAKHERTLTAPDETPAATNLISPLLANMTATTIPSSPWTGFDLLETNTPPKGGPISAPVDDEDEWGEMVSSPTVSTPPTTKPVTQSDTGHNTLLTTATTPQSTKLAASQDQSPEAMHTAPVVRLKSVISPTSALFKASSFMARGVEQRPIGPGILKPINRSTSVTVKDSIEEHSLPVNQEPVISPEPTPVPEPLTKVDALDDFSTRQSPSSKVNEEEKSEPEPLPELDHPVTEEPDRPSTLTQCVDDSAQSNIDSWANADFSFFESAKPATPPPQSKPDPSDPFSIFNGHERPTSAASQAKSFTRSPPRKVTPPPVQPLTGATNLAQRRKAGEDRIIEQILRGLPDMSYMLK